MIDMYPRFRRYHHLHKDESSPLHQKTSNPDLFPRLTMDHAVGNKIDSTVTHLLMYTKELLHTLEQWAYGKATEEQVSDVYVKLGNEFNHASRSFVEANIDISDLGDVPTQLRQVLEQALAEAASQRTLDNYLPSIREIVVTLLKQLKHKQMILRQQSTPKHNRAASNASSANSIVSANSRRRPSAPPGPHPNSTPSSNASTPVPAQSSSAPTTEPPNPPSQSPMRQPSDKKDDAMAQLQKSQALQRRASKRYSSYHMVKIMNGDQANALPTSAHHASHPADYTESSVIEERSKGRKALQPPALQTHIEMSPPVDTNEFDLTEHRPKRAPPSQTQTPIEAQSQIQPPPPAQRTPQGAPTSNSLSTHTPQIAVSPSNRRITVFLRLGKRVRKSSLPPSFTLAAIRLLFIDLFGFSPKAGETFPDLTIQDHDTGVEYELTEATLQDVRSGSLIALSAPSEQDIALESQMKELVQVVQDLSLKVDTRLGLKGTTPAIPPSARFKGAGSTTGPQPPVNNDKPAPSRAPKIDTASTDSFRQEFAVMRQICNKAISAMRQDVKKLQSQTTDLKTANSGNNRGYMTASQKKLGDDIQNLITWVDDLQDIVEAQRKDVASHGVRLGQQQLDKTSKSILKANQDLRELQQYIAKENPTWVKTWETELNTVVEEQQFFKLQEQLVLDLEADLNSARDTFELVEQCALELSKTDIKRNPLVVPQGGKKQDANTDLLGEIAALKPNHAERAEAIDRAERLRKRELEMRSDDFKQELGDFVEEGKLKKSGGLEEVERRRKERDEIMREEQARTDAEALKQKELEKEARRRQREAEREAERAAERAAEREESSAEFVDAPADAE